MRSITTWQHAVARARDAIGQCDYSTWAALYAHLRYVWCVIKCAVFYVWAHDGQLTVLKVYNYKYKNNWAHLLTKHDKAAIAAERVPGRRCVPPQHWWLGAGIVCSQEKISGDPWSDTYLPEITPVIRSIRAASTFLVLNKRDHPAVRNGGRDDPYCWTGAPKHLRHVEGAKIWLRCKLRIASFYSDHRWDDILVPNSVDCDVYWHGNGDDADAGAELIPKAVFRGSATGIGHTPATNLRVRLAHIVESSAALQQRFDVALVNYNRRFKLLPGPRLDTNSWTLRRCGPQHFLPMTEQRRYSCTLYLPGHAAANRLARIRTPVIICKPNNEHSIANNSWLLNRSGLKQYTLDDVFAGRAAPQQLPACNKKEIEMAYFNAIYS